MEEQKEPTIHKVDGKNVLFDEVAAGVILGVAKANCKVTYDMNEDRKHHFKLRHIERKLLDTEWLVIIANVDTTVGQVVADALMPGYDWDQYRNAGQVPYARGLASRKYIQEVLDIADPIGADDLRSVEQCIATVVIDFNTAVVYT
jgi:hypothetical protein